MADAIHRSTDSDADVVTHMFRGFRFRVCSDRTSALRALAVRRAVYVEEAGYDVPVPDEYDHRSWLLLAEDTIAGRTVGTLRVTPRSAGPLEVEEYFALPPKLRSPRAVELNRFAILPDYRKGKTFLPIVSLGLFKLVSDCLERMNAHYMVVASKPERVWTYRWLCFASTGLVTRYEKLDNAEHELLTCYCRDRRALAKDHPFKDFFLEARYPEIIVPKAMPRLGLVGEAEPVYAAI